MTYSLFFNVIVGFFLHMLRKPTLQFDKRTSDLIRYSIGTMVFIPLATISIILHVKNVKWHEIFTALFASACSYGGGVILGFLVEM